MTTGQLIKAARKEAGMTQAELAERLNVPFQSVSQWERDIRNPKKETLQKIAIALGVTLFDIDPEMHSFVSGFNRAIQTQRYLDAATPEAKEEAEDAVLALLDYFNKLDDYYQDRAVACLRAMAGLPFIEGESVQLDEKMTTMFLSLNADGQQKAIERVEELTEIPKYQRKAAPSDTTAEAPEDE